MESLLNSLHDSYSAEILHETSKNMDKFLKLNDWTKVKEELGRNGTNMSLNSATPTGDGDQTVLSNRVHAQVHRDVWSVGGDNIMQIQRGGLPPFVMHCFTGDEKYVRSVLHDKPRSEAEKVLLLGFFIISMIYYYFLYVVLSIWFILLSFSVNLFYSCTFRSYRMRILSRIPILHFTPVTYFLCYRRRCYDS